MYIKQLTVHGFKSYRDETIFGPFSPHHNIIVGRNGSGKSNFFAAVRFVLHDAYTKLGQEERQALLHEGGSTSLSAYVEIVFDNGDGRFPTGKDSTSIRRTVGLKKDEYSVDGRTSTKADVMNLLQSAGFSKSNPYYIVPQGRVTALTNAKDTERLALLKEVAGTRTYEEHRQESLKILEETTTKREKISELLVFIEDRLTELEEERTELTEYQAKEKERHTLEYVLQHRELVQIGEELAILENENGELIQGNSTTIAAFDDLTNQISKLKGQLKASKDRLKGLEEELINEDDQKGSLVQDQERLKLKVNESEAKVEKFTTEEEALMTILEKIKADISFKEDAMSDAKLKLKESEATQQERQGQIVSLEGRKEALMAKQGRSAQFRSAAERDRWIKKEIETMEENVKVHNRQIASVEDELTTAKVRIEDLTKLVEDLSRNEDNLSSDLNSLDTELHELRRRRDQLTEQRKELWRAENKLVTFLTTLREEASRYERSLMGSMERGTMEGIETVKRLEMPGVFGPMYELFEVDDVFRLATETIAGNSLFHIVVDNENTASRLLEIMIREKSGRVTFMPLNRLNPQNVTFPSDRQEALPLIEQLKYDSRFESAFRQVFGKAVICRDLSKGAAFARQAGLTAITLNGDRADRKGALSGGFIDVANSKLELASKYKSWSGKVQQHEQLLGEVKTKLSTVEPHITRTLGEIENLECRRAELNTGGGISELELRRRELAATIEFIAVKNKIRTSHESQINILQSRIGTMSEEVGTPLSSKLTLEEQKELSQIAKTIEGERQGINQLSTIITELATNVATWENELEIGLRRRRHEVTLQLGQVSTKSIHRDLHLAAEELRHASGRLDEVVDTIETLNKEIKEVTAEAHTYESTLDQARMNYDAATKKHGQSHATVEKYLTKRMGLLDRRDTVQRRICELAIAPDAPLYESVRDLPQSALLRRLHSANEELRTKFAHVNKKAHEQHFNFDRQGETLRERQKELNSSASAIEEFIKVLDRRKDEAIERTFQQVSKGFAKVFEKLVPAGRGELIMIRNGLVHDDDDDDNSMTIDTEIGNRGRFDFSGVAIQVSFNSKVDEGLLLTQLSGGQKSLVALALIFAIQKCDPAPFYLFDEIDANLDAAYRSSVANLLSELSHQAQFIITTFRPELLEAAESFWGVSFGGRVSRVESISREQALQFVEVDPVTTGGI